MVNPKQISFHESGRIHTKFEEIFLNKELPETAPIKQKPHIQKVFRTGNNYPEMFLAARILFPSVGVCLPVDQERKKIVWIEAPPAGKAVEVDIVFTYLEFSSGRWIGKNSMDSNLIGNFKLASRESVYVISRIEAIPQLPKVNYEQGVTEFTSGSNVDLISDPGLRAVAFGREKDGSLIFVETKAHFLPSN